MFPDSPSVPPNMTNNALSLTECPSWNDKFCGSLIKELMDFWGLLSSWLKWQMILFFLSLFFLCPLLSLQESPNFNLRPMSHFLPWTSPPLFSQIWSHFLGHLNLQPGLGLLILPDIKQGTWPSKRKPQTPRGLRKITGPVLNAHPVTIHTKDLGKSLSLPEPWYPCLCFLIHSS